METDCGLIYRTEFLTGLVHLTFGHVDIMIKLLRSSIVSSLLGLAWKNRSKIISAMSRSKAADVPENPTTGYGNTVGKDALVDPANAVSPQS